MRRNNPAPRLRPSTEASETAGHCRNAVRRQQPRDCDIGCRSAMHNAPRAGRPPHPALSRTAQEPAHAQRHPRRPTLVLRGQRRTPRQPRRSPDDRTDPRRPARPPHPGLEDRQRRLATARRQRTAQPPGQPRAAIEQPRRRQPPHLAAGLRPAARPPAGMGAGPRPQHQPDPDRTRHGSGTLLVRHPRPQPPPRRAGRKTPESRQATTPHACAAGSGWRRPISTGGPGIWATAWAISSPGCCPSPCSCSPEPAPQKPAPDTIRAWSSGKVPLSNPYTRA